MAASWVEVTVEVPTEHSEAVANVLLEAGAPGLQSEQRGRRALLTAHYASAPPLESLRRFCRDIGCPLSGPDAMAVQIRKIVERDWGEDWKNHFEPLNVGTRLCICAPWHPAVPGPRLAVVIEPGMAFGTGQHASTRGCLQLIERAVGRHLERAVDVGTGSGILAIALAKLGVPDVWAIDTDPMARRIAADHATANNVSNAVRIAATLDAVSGTFDLAVANLSATLLEELAPRLDRALRPDALLIGAGFLDVEEPQVTRIYERLGWESQQRYEEDGWVTLALHRGTPW